MGGDHGLSHEGSAVVALVRGCGRPGPCRIVAANLLGWRRRLRGGAASHIRGYSPAATLP
jgi:hypothetical protein